MLSTAKIKTTNVFISHPLVKGFLSLLTIVSLIIFSKLIFDKFYVSEKKALSQFLEHVMIRESGIYTLMDYKPVSLINLTYTPPTKEERYNHWQRFSLERKMEYSVDDMLYSSFKAPDIWKKWELVASKFLGTKYRFIPDGTGFVYFVNVPLAQTIVQEHLELFNKILGKNVTAAEIIDCIGDNSSPLWQELCQGHCLRGLLFGYGLQNALGFERYSQERRENAQKTSLSTKPTFVLIDNHPKITSVNIPTFRVFEGGEDQVEKYLANRKEILSKCNDKNFYSVTQQYLKQGL